MHQAVGGFACIVMRYPQRLQGAMVSTRSIDETWSRARVSATFRARVSGDEPRGSLASGARPFSSVARAARQASTQRNNGLETLPLASAPREVRHALSDTRRGCDIAARARRCTCATRMLNVFVASVAPLALPICLLARSEMRCYICDRSSSPLPPRAWQRSAPEHPTSVPISRGGLHRLRRSARECGGIAATTASVLQLPGVCQWRPSPRAVPASREGRSTKSS